MCKEAKLLLNNLEKAYFRGRGDEQKDSSCDTLQEKYFEGHEFHINSFALPLLLYDMQQKPE